MEQTESFITRNSWNYVSNLKDLGIADNIFPMVISNVNVISWFFLTQRVFGEFAKYYTNEKAF